MAILNYLKFALAFIDSGIVWLLRTVYNLFYQLTDLMLYSEKIVESLGQRIGLVLGIFMLFRLAVSLVNYLISPDKLNDNAKGGGKLLINVVISLVLLATVNIIFVQAYKIQDVIISSKFIEKIFFGTRVEEDRQEVDISYYLYTPLFQPNEEVFGDVCKTLWDAEEEIENKDGGACDTKLYEILGDDRRAIYRAFNTQDMSYVLSNFNVVTARQNNEYAFDYKILAPIAGIACALVLISFSMDLATRAVKLLFLQIIAPIPIIANIDPGKGQETFKKWYQECLKTYVSVFLRVITIDFAVYVITLLLTMFKDAKAFDSNPFINIMVIIGAFIFAKQVPKLIENIFGIKMEGTMALNPLKKIQDEALFGKQILGVGRSAVAGAIGIGAGALGGAIASGKLGNGAGVTAWSALRGAGRGLFGGLGAGYKSKNGFDAVRTGIGRYGTNADYVNSLDGTTFGGRTKAWFAQRAHVATEADETKKNIDNLNSFTQVSDSALKRAEAEMIKYNTLTLSDGTTMEQHKVEQQQLNRMKNTEIDKNDARYWVTHNGQSYFDNVTYDQDVAQRDKDIADLQDKIAKRQKQFATEYITQVHSGSLRDTNGNVVNDGELDNYINQIEHYQDKLSQRGYTFTITDAHGNIDGGKIKESRQKAVEQKQAIENNYNSKGINVYQQQQANAAATKPKGK